MTTYYKGFLVLNKNLRLKKIKYSSGYCKEKKDIEINILNTKYKLTYNENENENVLNYLIGDENNPPINTKKIFFKMLMSTKLYRKKEINIIYERITDKNGNVYGKEIITEFIFPLFNIDDIFTHNYYSFNRDITGNLLKLNGYIDYEKNDRDNFDLCKCYCVENEVADYNEIKEYKKKNADNFFPKFEFKERLEKLYNMNVFDESIIPNISIQVPNNQNSITSNISNLSNSYSTENGTLSREENISFPTNLSNNDFIEKLEKIKNKLNSLSDEDKALLKDLTNNNLNDSQIFEYIDMSREEMLEVLSSRAQQKSNKDNYQVLNGKPKVSLKKK